MSSAKPSSEAPTLASLMMVDPFKKSKPSGYRKKYNAHWEKDPILAPWLRPCLSDTARANCIICSRELRAHKNCLVEHAMTTKHLKNFAVSCIPEEYKKFSLIVEQYRAQKLAAKGKQQEQMAPKKGLKKEKESGQAPIAAVSQPVESSLPQFIENIEPLCSPPPDTTLLTEPLPGPIDNDVPSASHIITNVTITDANREVAAPACPIITLGSISDLGECTQLNNPDQPKVLILDKQGNIFVTHVKPTDSPYYNLYHCTVVFPEQGLTTDGYLAIRNDDPAGLGNLNQTVGNAIILEAPQPLTLVDIVNAIRLGRFSLAELVQIAKAAVDKLERELMITSVVVEDDPGNQEVILEQVPTVPVPEAMEIDDPTNTTPVPEN